MVAQVCRAAIYNSRNSFGLLARKNARNVLKLSTIVEIHLAY